MGFNCDIYTEFVLLLLKKEEVERLGRKLSGYLWGQFAWGTNPFTDGQRSAVFAGHLKHSSIQDLNESTDDSMIC